MSARDSNGRFAPAPEAEAQEGALSGAELWRVVMPARDAFAAKTIGIYVKDGDVVATIGGAEWALWQNWNRHVKPWFAKRQARGSLVAEGERLEL